MSVRKFLLISLILAGPAFADPDYAPINKALTDFLNVVEKLRDEIPKIHDAAAAAKALDSLAAVANAFSASMEECFRKYPELKTAPEPPPELAAVLKRFASMKEVDPTLGPDLGQMIKPYTNDPTVREAFYRLGGALQRVERLRGQR